MSASKATIRCHKKHYMMAMVVPEDFECGDWQDADPSIVLADPGYSLYCLDAEKRQAVFVKTPDTVDLTKDPFLFQAQYLHASELLAMDFEDFHRLANKIRSREEQLLFIHSVGRCGSTLLSKVFWSLPQVCSLSEPDTFTQLGQWRCTGELPDEELHRLCDSSVRFYSKAWPGKGAQDFHVFKFRAQCIEVADWLFKSFPKAKQAFIHRDPISWIYSVFRTFVNSDALQDPGFPAFFEEVWAQFFPQIREAKKPGYPMSLAQTWIMVWICVHEARKRILADGLNFHELDYQDLRKQPEPCLQALFDYCGLEVEDWKPIWACLARDSQAGSIIARDKVKEQNTSVDEDVLEETREMLQHWGYQESVSGLLNQ